MDDKIGHYLYDFFFFCFGKTVTETQSYKKFFQVEMFGKKKSYANGINISNCEIAKTNNNLASLQQKRLGTMK